MAFSFFGPKYTFFLHPTKIIRTFAKNNLNNHYRITLSVCATALGIMDILESNHSSVRVCKNESGCLTGEVEIIPC